MAKCARSLRHRQYPSRLYERQTRYYFRRKPSWDLLHLGHGADRVLDRHFRVEPGRAIDVDVIGAEPPQTICQKVLDRRRAVVDANPAPGGVTQRAELGR